MMHVLESRVDDEHAGQFQARLLGHFCYLCIRLKTADELNTACCCIWTTANRSMDVHLNHPF
jgi:hypothetical protein